MKSIISHTKTILRSRIFIVCMLLLFALIFLWPFIVAYSIRGYMDFQKVFAWDWQGIFRTLRLLLGIAVVAFLTALYILPILLFGFRRIATYISVSFFCLRHGYRFKLTRVPFFSLGGVKNKADMEIADDGEKYCVHFMDVPFRFRSVLTVVDGDKYVISRSRAGRLEKKGGAVGGRVRALPIHAGARQTTGLFQKTEYAIVEGKDKIKDLPDFESDKDHEHILLMDSVPVDARFKNDSSLEALSNGEKLDSMTFFYKKGFLRLLRR